VNAQRPLTAPFERGMIRGTRRKTKRRTRNIVRFRKSRLDNPLKSALQKSAWGRDGKKKGEGQSKGKDGYERKVIERKGAATLSSAFSGWRITGRKRNNKRNRDF